MRNKQRSLYKFVDRMAISLILLLFLSSSLYGQDRQDLLVRADSLFAQKQYTQSFTRYKKLLDKRMYSPSMLLKMAFLQEGMGNIASAIYYLNLYYLVTGDQQIIGKIEKMVEAHQLWGYRWDSLTLLRYLLTRYYAPLTAALSLLLVAALGMLIYRRKKQKQRPYKTAVAVVALSALLFAHARFNDAVDQCVTSRRQTYIMSGPSSGASVKEVVGAGNRLSVRGHKDVWLRVRWGDREGYVKENQVLPIAL